MVKKQSNVCPVCSSWMNIKIVNNIEWLYCDQRHYFKVAKDDISLLRESPNHSENADEYYRKKRKNE